MPQYLAFDLINLIVGISSLINLLWNAALEGEGKIMSSLCTLKVCLTLNLPTMGMIKENYGVLSHVSVLGNKGGVLL